MLSIWGFAFINATWSVVVLSAPWLLLGFFLAGCAHAFLPTSFVEKHLQKPGMESVVKATLIGTPLPICSCGVIPLAVSLRKKGASRGATTAFLVSTPEIGVDSFTLSWFLLGPTMALARLLTAIVSSLSIGFLVEKIVKDPPPSPTSTAQEATRQDKPCCCAKKAETCCEAPPSSEPKAGGILSLAHKILHYGFVKMVAELAGVLALGLICAGLISSVLPDNYFNQTHLNRHIAMFAMLIFSMPTYVCSVASTPLAAVLLAKGLDPGAVLVFLLGGPATNIPVMLAIHKELGKSSLVIYITGILSCTLLAGYVLSYGFPNSFQHIDVPVYAHSDSNIAELWGVLLSILLVVGIAQKPFLKKMWARADR